MELILERKLDLLIQDSLNPYLYNEIGVILFQMKDWENAKKFFQRARELMPDNTDFLFNLGIVLYKQSEWELAKTTFQKYLQINPSDVQIIQKLGDTFYLLGEYEQAEKFYTEISEK